jgi:ubiquinone/menaquinone biosynthesis C-methylase UbiE
VSDGHPDISADRFFYLQEQQVVVEDFDSSGWVLTLGGGGEGVIGRLKGSRVVAIDTDRRELEEAPEGPLKMVMDARDLKFLDESFEVVTSFFTLMYVGQSDHLRIFEEAWRVLVPGGRFLIWGASVPERPDDGKDVLVVPVMVTLPSDEVETGYGVVWPEEPFGLADHVERAERVGFEVVEQREEGQVFCLSLRKGVED